MDSTVYRNLITEEIDSSVFILNGKLPILLIIGERHTPVITITGNHLVIGNLDRRMITGITILTNLQKITLLAVFLIGELIHPVLTVFLGHFCNELTILVISSFVKLINMLFDVIELALIGTELLTVLQTASLYIVYLLDINHIVMEIFSNIHLRQGLFLRVLQPLAQPGPTVFTSLDAAKFLQHLQPLLRSGLVLLDLLQGKPGIADEDGRLAIRSQHIADVRYAVIETLAGQDDIIMSIIGNEVIELGIIRSILISILHTIVKAPLGNVITIPPNAVNRDFLLNDTVVFPTVNLGMQICILTTRRNPVTITENIFLDVCRNGTVHLNGALTLGNSLIDIVYCLNTLVGGSIFTSGVFQTELQVRDINTMVDIVGKSLVTLKLFILPSFQTLLI